MTVPLEDEPIKANVAKPARKKREDKFVAERRMRKVRRTLQLGVAVAAVIALVAGAVMFSPPAVRGPCDADLNAIHYHARLDIYNGANLQTIPSNIGLSPDLWKDHTLDACASGPGAAALHVHEGQDEDNVIHIEAKINRAYALGEFFAIWGQPIGPTKVWLFSADTTHSLRMAVNGNASAAWGDLVLADGQVIEIHYDRTG